MRTLIVSDTHGRESNLKKAIKKSGPLDYMVHLGDSESTQDHLKGLAGCPVMMVAGNCDYLTGIPQTRVEEIDGCRILMTHGHTYFVSAVGARDLIKEAKKNDCQVVMFGHTHRPFIDESDSAVTVMNPGSLSFPRQEGRRPSYILMETSVGKEPVFTLKFL